MTAIAEPAHGQVLPRRGRPAAWATLAVLVVLAGCSTVPDRAAPPPDEGALTKPPPTELGRGLASWYGPGFHGRRTASGERFDMNGLTAAHRTIAFGTRVLVRNPLNGREVVVRINDRGPQVADRIIDLSKAAAEALGAVQLGQFPVVLLQP